MDEADTLTARPVEFTDPYGVSTLIPYHRARIWDAVSRFIRLTWIPLHGEPVFDERHYNILTSEGRVIWSIFWEQTIRPGDNIVIRPRQTEQSVHAHSPSHDNLTQRDVSGGEERINSSAECEHQNDTILFEDASGRTYYLSKATCRTWESFLEQVDQSNRSDTDIRISQRLFSVVHEGLIILPNQWQSFLGRIDNRSKVRLELWHRLEDQRPQFCNTVDPNEPATVATPGPTRNILGSEGLATQESSQAHTSVERLDEEVSLRGNESNDDVEPEQVNPWVTQPTTSSYPVRWRAVGCPGDPSVKWRKYFVRKRYKHRTKDPANRIAG